MSIHHLEIDIVSAESSVFSGQALMVAVTGELGELGIKPGHAPLLTRLAPGQVRLTLKNEQTEVFYISGGLLEVQPMRVTVLADLAERADSLDEAKALEAEKQAREALIDKKSEIDYSQASAQLAQAMAQLHAIKRIRSKKNR